MADISSSAGDQRHATAPDAKTQITRPMVFRGGGFAPKSHPLVTAVAILALLAFWQAATIIWSISPTFLPSPERVGRSLWRMIETGELWRHLSASLYRIGWGWFLGTLFGVAIGVMIGLFTVARAVGAPLVAALYPVPKIALLPLFILWLGIGEGSKVATIGLSVFFPTVIATYAGVDAVPRNLIRMAQSFNVPLWRIVWSLLLPGALAGMLAGFRISIAAALLVLVAAEMIGAQFGLGAFLILTGNMLQTDKLMAGVVVLSAMGLTASWLVTLIERRVLHWR
ncbi:ABC transporter permease [Roseinatronobacter sp. NSM]|uniref:ABC transporter permease n=1 Tax=Roseinatronobacter sp. NSM TaxID=3457785 RepID=UPI0040366C64